MIFFIGPRYSGKSTVGAATAARLRCAHLDLDQILADTLHTTLDDYVTAHGWPSFRDKEAAMLENLVMRYNALKKTTSDIAVMSCGGGTPLSPQNQALMRACGLVLYLKPTPELLLSRAKADKHPRPPLTKLPPEQEILQILQERDPIYSQTAHYTLHAALRPDLLAAQSADLYLNFLSLQRHV